MEIIDNLIGSKPPDIAYIVRIASRSKSGAAISLVAEIERQMRISDDIIRFLSVRDDDLTEELSVVVAPRKSRRFEENFRLTDFGRRTAAAARPNGQISIPSAMLGASSSSTPR